MRLLPFMDDYLFVGSSKTETLEMRGFVEETLERLGLARNPKKGYWEPVQELEHLGSGGALLPARVAHGGGNKSQLEQPSKSDTPTVTRSSLDTHQLSTAGNLPSFRDALSTTVSFVWFNGFDTNHGLLESDLQVDPETLPARQIRLFPRKRKGKRRQQHLKQVRTVNVAVAAHPRLAAMLTTYKARRAKAFADAGQRPPAQLWALPGENPQKWTANVQNTWMKRALDWLGLKAPPEFSWTSHSLRSGPASAAHAIVTQWRRPLHGAAELELPHNIMFNFTYIWG